MYSGLQAVQLIQTLIFLSLVWTFCCIKCILELLIYFPLIVNNQSGQTAYNLQKKMTFEGINKPWHRHIFDLLNNTNLYRHPPNPPCLWSIVCLLLFIMPIKEHLFNPADPKSTETFLSFFRKNPFLWNEANKREESILHTIVPDSFLLWWTKSQEYGVRIK